MSKLNGNFIPKYNNLSLANVTLQTNSSPVTISRAESEFDLSHSAKPKRKSAYSRILNNTPDDLNPDRLLFAPRNLPSIQRFYKRKMTLGSAETISLKTTSGGGIVKALQNFPATITVFKQFNPDTVADFNKIHRNFSSCLNLTNPVTDEIKTVNAVEESIPHRETEGSSGDSEQITPVSRLMRKYTATMRIEGNSIKYNKIAAVGLLEDFFDDFAKAMPAYDELMKNLKSLATALKQDINTKQQNHDLKQQNHHLNTQHSLLLLPPRVQNKISVKHKVIKRTKTKEEAEMSKEIRLTPPKEKNQQKNLSGLVLKSPQSEGKAEKISIPKLRLEMIPGKVKEFQEEFLGNIDAFSQSWRDKCKDMLMKNNKK